MKTIFFQIFYFYLSKIYNYFDLDILLNYIDQIEKINLSWNWMANKKEILDFSRFKNFI